jgi:hypothetical protein
VTGPPAPRLLHLSADGLAPFSAGLRALEASIPYPAGDQSFTIDHGPSYHRFFSGMGAAHFVVASTPHEVVGNVVGVRKSVSAGGRPLPALYICDLKVAASQRGRGLARRMLAFGLWRIFVTSELRQARMLFGAAMVGARGDVTRSARGATPLRLTRPWMRGALYFAAPAALAAIDPAGCPSPPSAEVGLDLSPEASGADPGIASTAGSKDLRLSPHGHPWPLVHLPRGPSAWRPTWGHYLRACGQALVAAGSVGPACFGLDERLADHQAWLAGQGLAPGAAFNIHGLDLTGAVRRASWIHLASSEI